MKDIRSIISAFLMRMNREATARSGGIRSLRINLSVSLRRYEIDRVYHAVLKDHPELFWVHNREKVYKTTYSGRDYCQFSPGYTYTEAQRQEITQAMENA